MTSVWTNIKSTIASGINWMIEKINALIEKVNSVSGSVGIKLNPIAPVTFQT